MINNFNNKKYFRYLCYLIIIINNLLNMQSVKKLNLNYKYICIAKNVCYIDLYN